MNKALEYFEDMVSCNQLDYNDEKPKCELIRNQLRAIKCLESGAVIDIKQKKVVFVNKIIDLYDVGLCIRGYDNSYRIEDYGKTWREVTIND